MKHIKLEVVDKVATLTLNRPERRNAFNAEMIEEWHTALLRCATDDATNAIVVTGAGTAFCAGGDLKVLDTREHETPLMRKSSIWEGIARIPLLLERIDKPVFAAVNGVATGAGMDMALMADIRYCSESARFAETYIKVGLVPGDGGAWLLPRLVGTARALEMLWSGDFIDATEAETIGLVNKVLPDNELLEYTQCMAARFANGPVVATRMIKRALYQGLRTDLRTHLDQITSHMGIVAMTSDHREAMEAFREKRPPKFGDQKQ